MMENNMEANVEALDQDQKWLDEVNAPQEMEVVRPEDNPFQYDPDDIEPAYLKLCAKGSELLATHSHLRAGDIINTLTHEKFERPFFFLPLSYKRYINQIEHANKDFVDLKKKVTLLSEATPQLKAHAQNRYIGDQLNLLSMDGIKWEVSRQASLQILVSPKSDNLRDYRLYILNWTLRGTNTHVLAVMRKINTLFERCGKGGNPLMVPYLTSFKLDSAVSGTGTKSYYHFTITAGVDHTFKELKEAPELATFLSQYYTNLGVTSQATLIEGQCK